MVKLFTVSGQWVRTLSPSSDPTRTEWDRANDSGEGVASGLYLYVISAQGDKKTGKLVIIK